MLPSLARLLLDTSLVAMLLFVGAGTGQWARAWILLALVLVIRTIGAVIVHRVHPELLRERARLPVHHEQPLADRVLLLGILGSGFLGLALVAAMDVWRWRLMPPPSFAVSLLGLIAVACGWGLKSMALHANAFAIAVVRPQQVRGQVLADQGVYRWVRHPFYAADLLILPGQGLWLGSWVAVIAAAVPVALMVRRLQLEERFLQTELPGYGGYMERVPYRVIPGVW